MKKGQAAMEFLMTYGWAILVVLIAIGALAYFGVLNPSRFLPRSCTLMPGLDCPTSDLKIQASDNTVHFKIRNGIGENIDFSALNMDVDGTTCTAINPAAINDGALSPDQVITCPDALVGAVGERFRGSVTGTYTLGTSTVTHTLTGTIVTPVE